MFFCQKICNDIKHLPAEDLSRLRIRRHALTGTPEVHCFMERLDEFLKVGKKKIIDFCL